MSPILSILRPFQVHSTFILRSILRPLLAFRQHVRLPNPSRHQKCAVSIAHLVGYFDLLQRLFSRLKTRFGVGTTCCVLR